MVFCLFGWRTKPRGPGASFDIMRADPHPAAAGSPCAWTNAPVQRQFLECSTRVVDAGHLRPRSHPTRMSPTRTRPKTQRKSRMCIFLMNPTCEVFVAGNQAGRSIVQEGVVKIRVMCVFVAVVILASAVGQSQDCPEIIGRWPYGPAVTVAVPEPSRLKSAGVAAVPPVTA